MTYKNSTIKIWRAAAFIGILLLYYTNVSAQTLKVHTTDYRQKIDMIGGDMERSSKAIQTASQNPEEIIDWVFGDIEFNVCRVQYDKNQELEEGTQNWDYYTKQVTTMLQVKAASPNIKFFATLRSDYDGYSDNNNLPDWICDYDNKVIDTDKYAVFLADYLEYMEQQGVAISILSVVKEWASFAPADVARDIINNLSSECSSRGITMPEIYDQGFWGLNAAKNYISDVSSLGTKDLYTAFCSHNYGGGDGDDWAEVISAAASLGKDVYDDETNAGAGGPTAGVEVAIGTPLSAYTKKCVTYEAGLKGEVLFELWSRGINNETRAVYFPWGGTGTRLRGYYITKLFSNNILDHNYMGTETVSMSDVATMAFRKDNKIVLWVINSSTTSYSSQEISLVGESLNSNISSSYWTESTAITGVSSTISASGDSFTANIQAESLNCFIFEVSPNTNLALNGIADESSTSYNDPSVAIDGNTNGAWSGGSVTHTNSESNPWWEVELDGTYRIGNIHVFNRTDACCKDRLTNFTVSVINSSGNTTFSKSYTTYPDPSVVVDANGASGNTIRVQLDDTNPLSLAEVEVYEHVSVFVPDPNMTYYIDCPALGYRLAATGASEDPYTTSTSTTGVDVEWVFTDKGNGYWHIDRAAGGTKPRLRSDNTDLADMQAISSTGGWTYFDFANGASAGTYFLTLPDGPSSYKRLAFTSAPAIKMASTASTGTWVSFRITEASSKKNNAIKQIEEQLGETLVYPNPFSDEINVANAIGAKVDVYNINGKLILSKEIDADMKTINLQQLDKGVYIIGINNNGERKLIKMIKQ